MYAAKVVVWGFSPYTAAARCSQFCDGMPGLGPSLNKEEVILDRWFKHQVQVVRSNEANKDRTTGNVLSLA